MIVRAMEAIAMVTVAIYSYCHGNCVVLPHFMGKWLTSASKKLMIYTHPWLYVYIAV